MQFSWEPRWMLDLMCISHTLNTNRQSTIDKLHTYLHFFRRVAHGWHDFIFHSLECITVRWNWNWYPQFFLHLQMERISRKPERFQIQEYTTGSIVLSKRQMWNDFYNEHTMNKQHVDGSCFSVIFLYRFFMWFYSGSVGSVFSANKNQFIIDLHCIIKFSQTDSFLFSMVSFCVRFKTTNEIESLLSSWNCYGTVLFVFSEIRNTITVFKAKTNRRVII